MKYLYRWAAGNMHMSESKLRLEEFFLWGCQTAQHLAGKTSKSPEFIVETGMVMNKRFTAVLGWYIKTRNGESRQLLFAGKGLKRVIVKRGRKVKQAVAVASGIPRPRPLS